MVYWLVPSEAVEQEGGVCALEAVERASLHEMDEMDSIGLSEEDHYSHGGSLSDPKGEVGTYMGKFRDCLSDSEMQPKKEIDKSGKRLRSILSKPLRLIL